MKFQAPYKLNIERERERFTKKEREYIYNIFFKNRGGGP